MVMSMPDRAKIDPASPVLYIKLGDGGKWEQQCIKEKIIRFGYGETSEKALNGDWDGVRDHWLSKRKDQGAATRDLTQIHYFIDGGEDTVWITFHDRFLWWCHAKPGAKLHPDYGTYRETVDGWHKTDVSGKNDLSFEKLSGSLLKTQAYRGTICAVQESPYLIKKLNGELSEKLAQAKAAEDNLTAKLVPLIQSLHPKDFELLVDLVFTGSGWRRLSAVGDTQKTIDIVLQLPTTNEKAYVQVKSVAKQSDIAAHVKFLRDSHAVSRLFFVFHTGVLTELDDYENVHFINGDKLARMVLNAGLTSWLIDKNS